MKTERFFQTPKSHVSSRNKTNSQKELPDVSYDKEDAQGDQAQDLS